MRRFLGLIVIPVLACVVLAGCGGSSNALPPTATPSANTNAKVTASGQFGVAPTVNIPKVDASTNLNVRTLIQGTGPTWVKTDSLVVNFVLYFWTGKSASLKASTYPSNPAIISGSMIPGLQSALTGQKVGSRVLAVIPPAQGYGTSGDAELGVGGNTTLVFVIDMLKEYSATASASGTQESNGGNGLPTVSATPGHAPVVTIPSSAPPTTLQVKTLIKGTGPAIAKGEYVIAQYVGYIWRTKKVFGSSWSSDTPFGFIFQDPTPQVISGWDIGLAGQPVGSRVLLVIPPKDGYGTSGASQAGIKGTDTLVYVVDILDAFTHSAS
jgi:FKBP-type peptidyl-prolyl cis-trans isomerase